MTLNLFPKPRSTDIIWNYTAEIGDDDCRYSRCNQLIEDYIVAVKFLGETRYGECRYHLSCVDMEDWISPSGQAQ